MVFCLWIRSTRGCWSYRAKIIVTTLASRFFRFDCRHEVSERIGDRRSIVQDAILDDMDHLEVLREKVATLRAEIVLLEKLNERYRRQRQPDAQSHFAHGKRQQRLFEIQQELTQIAGLGGRLHSVEQVKEQLRFPSSAVKKAS